MVCFYDWKPDLDVHSGATDGLANLGQLRDMLSLLKKGAADMNQRPEAIRSALIHVIKIIRYFGELWR